jgi:hypothetical protein
MEIRNSPVGEMKFNVDSAQWKDLIINGLSPRIIGVVPLSNAAEFYGQ